MHIYRHTYRHTCTHAHLAGVICHTRSNQKAIQVCMINAPANASSANMTHNLTTICTDSFRRSPKVDLGRHPKIRPEFSDGVLAGTCAFFASQ